MASLCAALGPCWGGVIHLHGTELTKMIASLTELAAEVKAAQSAVLLAAHSRGVIVQPDDPRPAD